MIIETWRKKNRNGGWEWHGLRLIIEKDVCISPEKILQSGKKGLTNNV